MSFEFVETSSIVSTFRIIFGDTSELVLVDDNDVIRVDEDERLHSNRSFEDELLSVESFFIKGFQLGCRLPLFASSECPFTSFPLNVFSFAASVNVPNKNWSEDSSSSME